MRQAEWIEELDGGYRCRLCPRGCIFRGDDADGFCGVRGLRDGSPALPGYGRCVSLSVDPIEKKPLYHFRPGTLVLSSGPAGCNLSCDFCQNWSISQGPSRPSRYVAPEQLAELALSSGSSGVAYTYTEPTIWYEYIVDTAPLVRERGGYAVMVSNGYVELEPLSRLLEVTDAWNIDLKAWSEGFYRERCGGRVEPVKRSLRAVAESDTHLEVTFLVIPGENDHEDDWRRMAGWLAGSCGADTPLHISRYFPRYRLRREATPAETVHRAVEVFRETLDFVYPGNMHGALPDVTCPDCGLTWVTRRGEPMAPGIREGKCRECGRDANVVL